MIVDVPMVWGRVVHVTDLQGMLEQRVMNKKRLQLNQIILMNKKKQLISEQYRHYNIV